MEFKNQELKNLQTSYQNKLQKSTYDNQKLQKLASNYQTKYLTCQNKSSLLIESLATPFTSTEASNHVNTTSVKSRPADSRQADSPNNTSIPVNSTSKKLVSVNNSLIEGQFDRFDKIVNNETTLNSSTTVSSLALLNPTQLPQTQILTSASNFTLGLTTTVSPQSLQSNQPDVRYDNLFSEFKILNQKYEKLGIQLDTCHLDLQSATASNSELQQQIVEIGERLSGPCFQKISGTISPNQTLSMTNNTVPNMTHNSNQSDIKNQAVNSTPIITTQTYACGLSFMLLIFGLIFLVILIFFYSCKQFKLRHAALKSNPTLNSSPHRLPNQNTCTNNNRSLLHSNERTTNLNHQPRPAQPPSHYPQFNFFNSTSIRPHPNFLKNLWAKSSIKINHDHADSDLLEEQAKCLTSPRLDHHTRLQNQASHLKHNPYGLVKSSSSELSNSIRLVENVSCSSRSCNFDNNTHLNVNGKIRRNLSTPILNLNGADMTKNTSLNDSEKLGLNSQRQEYHV